MSAFETNELPEAAPVPFEERLAARGVGRNKKETVIALIFFSVLCLLLSAYVLISAVPKAHVLGPDKVRDGETLPAYAQ